MRFLSLLLLGLCACLVSVVIWSVCEVVLVHYVDLVVVVTVMHVLLLVLQLCMLRECEDDGNAGVGPVRVWCVSIWWVVHVVQVLCLPPTKC